MDAQQVLSFWQRARVQAIVQHMLGASGLIGAGVVKLCHYFGWPAPDLGTITEFAMAGVPLAISGAFSWWHDHPNNLAARLIKQINGDAVSPDKKEALAKAIINDGAS